MKRRTLAAIWITGSIVPVLLASVFVFGCCVLPFHRVVHKVMPVCHVAVDVMRGQEDAAPAAPASEKQEPAKRIATTVPQVFRLATSTSATSVAAPVAATSYRSFITLGAVRCDRDVGLHILVETFLI